MSDQSPSREDRSAAAPAALRPGAAVASPPSFFRRAVLYPQYYTWYVFLSALDVLFTWLILSHGGQELNALADWIIDRYNIAGIAVYKFGLVVSVLLICEVVGRRCNDRGRTLARWVLILASFPVIVGAAHLLQITTHKHTH